MSLIGIERQEDPTYVILAHTRAIVGHLSRTRRPDHSSGAPMTFTIIARCPRSGEAGIAITTVSLAVGGLVPFYTPAGDIIATQAYACAKDGHVMLQAMLAGDRADAAMARARAADPHESYRQFMILARNGDAVAYTGPDCRPWAGDIVDGDVIVAGNVLAGRQVVEAMHRAYRAAMQETLAERLLRALEAGRDAGGQALPDGRAIAERSAMIRVLGAGADAGFPVVDLRVDVHPSAVHELRRIHAIHAVYADYATLRDQHAPAAPSIVAFEAEQLKKGGVFAERPSCFR